MTTFNINDERNLPRRVSLCPVPTSVPSNASFALTYSGSNLTQIDKVVDGVTYRRTLTYTGSLVDTISAWVQV